MTRSGIYTDVFSQEELEALVEFYRSPAGRSMERTQQELMQRTMAVSQAKLQGPDAPDGKDDRGFQGLGKRAAAVRYPDERGLREAVP